MKRLALTLIISALATIAHAGDEGPSLLRCGINFGGKSLVYQANTEAKNKKDRRMNHVAGAVRAEPLRFSTPQSGTPKRREVRLPRKITFATIGCSWR